MRPRYDIAIVGGGFAGCQLVRRLVEGKDGRLRIALVDRGRFLATGPAYATKRPEHLLNVRAGDMGADPERVGDFHRWLRSVEAGASLAAVGLASPPEAEAFVPRRLYGDYLRQRWVKTQAMAHARGILLDVITQEAQQVGVSPDGLRLDCVNGEHLASARLVLAVGNDFATAGPSSRAIRQPWQFDFEGERARHSTGRPVVIVGTGLTAIDTLLSLEGVGWQQPILAISRRGLLPRPHAAPAPAWTMAPESFGAAPRLSSLLRHLRQEVRAAAAQGVAWQSVMEGLRPHTAALWRNLPPIDQERVLRRYESLWNVHRHRMPFEVARRIEAMQARGQLRVLRARCGEIVEGEGGVRVTVDGAPLEASLLFDCRGPGRALAARPPLSSLIERGLAMPHPSGVGLATDGAYRLRGPAPIYALGNLLTGERLESTAVPELRQQVAEVADVLFRSLSSGS